jgi:hypothetical protein
LHTALRSAAAAEQLQPPQLNSPHTMAEELDLLWSSLTCCSDPGAPWWLLLKQQQSPLAETH